MYGAVIGDIIGSRFEFSNTLSKDFSLLDAGNCCFTDDTVMSCAVADALMKSLESGKPLAEQAVLSMQEVGRKYPACGYGRKFIDWMFTEKPEPYNSCGNGSAMRISAVGFAAKSMEDLKEMSAAVTAVSHNHPEGMKGAEATAAAIFLARQGKTKEEIKEYIIDNYGYDLSMTVDELRDKWQGHGKEICQVSVPQAFICFLEGTDYEDVIRNCISIGGDSDTIAAIAGGIAGAYYGIPESLVQEAKSYLSPYLLEICERFESLYPGKLCDVPEV